MLFILHQKLCQINSYYLLSNLMLVTYFTLNFLFIFSYELFNITLDFAVENPFFEFTLIFYLLLQLYSFW